MRNKILMIDDCVEMCAEVAEALSDEGYSVTLAHDGESGDRLLTENKYDLVLLDLKMPGIDGFEVLKRLRKRDDDIKVVIVTARPIVSDLLKSEGGLDDREYETLKQADGVVSKPYDMSALIKTIKGILS